MFSSNQKFCVSCTEDQLKGVVELALSMYTVGKRKPSLAYQTTAEKIAIGYFYDEPDKGWNKFMFDDPGMDFVLAAIKQFTKDHPSCEYEGGDGSHYPGYIVELVEGGFASEWDGIKNPCRGIFSVRAFNCYYSK